LKAEKTTILDTVECIRKDNSWERTEERTIFYGYRAEERTILDRERKSGHFRIEGGRRIILDWGGKKGLCRRERGEPCNLTALARRSWKGNEERTDLSERRGRKHCADDSRWGKKWGLRAEKKYYNNQTIKGGIG
jgi:hypothetical protein